MKYKTEKIPYYKDYTANGRVSDVISLNGHQKPVILNVKELLLHNISLNLLPFLLTPAVKMTSFIVIFIFFLAPSPCRVGGHVRVGDVY